jgi:hypothetical protein
MSSPSFQRHVPAPPLYFRPLCTVLPWVPPSWRRGVALSRETSKSSRQTPAGRVQIGRVLEGNPDTTYYGRVWVGRVRAHQRTFARLVFLLVSRVVGVEPQCPTLCRHPLVAALLQPWATVARPLVGRALLEPGLSRLFLYMELWNRTCDCDLRSGLCFQPVVPLRILCKQHSTRASGAFRQSPAEGVVCQFSRFSGPARAISARSACRRCLFPALCRFAGYRLAYAGNTEETNIIRQGRWCPSGLTNRQ